MGEIRVIVTLENEQDIVLFKAGYISKNKLRHVKINALVDTGAVMVLLPQDIVEKLGIEVFDKTVVTLANEEKIELNIAGNIILTVCGRKMVTDCLVGPPLCEPLIGQLVLERLDLILNPQKKTITVNPTSPNLPHLKMK